jgi:multidrug resistance efflux pump
MQALCLSVIAAVAIAQRGAGEGAVERPREAHMPHCLISLIDEALIPAEERGVLMQLNVREGASVRSGEILAQIDDREALVAKEAADLKLASSDEQLANDVQIRYSRKAAEVAKAEHDEAVDANRREPGTYSAGEVRRMRLEWEKSVLQIEQSEVQHKIDSYENHIQRAEVKAAQMGITKREIDSPVDGIVVELYKHRGEWVEPGQPIMRVVRMDTLRVEGFLRSDDFSPEEVLGREVTIVIRLARGRTVKLPSKISFVSPLVEGSGEYRLWAELKNTAPAGYWLIRPGLMAEMTIHLR